MSADSMPDRPTVSIRFSAAEIAARVDVMAAELAAKLPADTLVVSVLKGSFVFAADLIRALSRAGANWSMDFLTLSSYGTGTQTRAMCASCATSSTTCATATCSWSTTSWNRA